MLIGHSRNKQLLMELIKSQKIPQAFLFYGPEGVGKATFAKAFAHGLVKSSEKLDNQEEKHPDIRIYSIEEGSSYHTIQSMRHLKEEVYLPPFCGHRKVFIIEEAHRMLPACGNALLKTLEEPAPNSILILLAESSSGLLPTITSRCCKIPFSLLKEKEIADFLVQKGIEKERSELIAKQSFGSLDQALLMMNEEEGKWQEILLELLLDYKEAPSEHFQKQLSFLDEQLEKKGGCFSHYLYEIVLKLLRDIAFIKEEMPSSFLFFKLKEEKIRKAANQTSHSFFMLQKIWEEAFNSLTYHVKLKVSLEVLLIRLYQ